MPLKWLFCLKTKFYCATDVVCEQFLKCHSIFFHLPGSRKRSIVWKFVEKVDDGINRCKLCRTEIVGRLTGNWIRHHRRFHPEVYDLVPKRGPRNKYATLIVKEDEAKRDKPEESTSEYDY